MKNIGEKIQEFYNKIPFPDYDLDKFNCIEDIKLTVYPFAKIIDRSIPKNASIIDIGTGTGLLSAFLSLRRKKVWGIDFSDNSLIKARQLKNKLKLNSWVLKKVDILNEEEINQLPKFDYILCLGVLHHIGDSYKAFKNILNLLKPNGKIAIGLYNKFGRIPLKIRILLSKTIFKNNQKMKDYFIKIQITDLSDKTRKIGWWNDQYQHVYEKTFTVGKILKWFKDNNISYCQTVPSSNPFDQSMLEIAGVWNNEIYPYLPIRIYKQLTWIWKTQREGGYWITFGCREKSLNLSKDV